MDTLIDLEYCIEQQCWHYNYGNDPKRPEWFTVAEQQPLWKVSAFCDIVDAAKLSSLMTKQGLAALFMVFNAGYEAGLTRNG